MHLPKEFFNQLNPSYQKVIIELEEKLEACQKECQENNSCQPSTEYQLYNIIKEFSKNYLTPKEYWNYLNTFQFLQDYRWQKDLSWNAYHNHFYLRENGNQEITNIDGINKNVFDSSKYFKLMRVKNKFKADERDFCFPNAYLKECFQIYEKNLDSPPTKETIRKLDKLIKLYEKIEAAENNANEWFKLLLEAEDHDFVCDNVEYALNHNLVNIELWKLFIQSIADFSWMTMKRRKNIKMK